jgi:feruloyl esterase
MRTLTLVAIAAALIAAAAGLGVAQTQSALAAQCALPKIPPDVRITKTTAVAVGDDIGIPNGGKATRPFCRVEGVIEKEIGFELWLPAKRDWNGGVYGAGVGGQAGVIGVRELARAAQRGYAAASNDSGHKNTERNWLLGDPMRAENYAGRANHVMTQRVKAMVAAYYGRDADNAVFVGCSGGGRQAMTELQRYPEDYDAIIAGAPGVDTPQMSARRMWEMVQHTKSAGLMADDDWKLVAASAVAACDADDGLKDGVIGSPMNCKFDIASLKCPRSGRCLSEAQIAFARKIYAPLKTESGKQIDDGVLPGTPVAVALVPEANKPGPAYLAVALFGDGVHRDPKWDARTFNVDQDLAAIDKVMNLHADDPQIDAFVARGGKLILYHGLADPFVSARPTIKYFEALQTRFGAAKAKSFVRLFLVPGMDHCAGGGVPDRFGAAGAFDAPTADVRHDLLSAMAHWRKDGVAPERIVASKVENGAVVQTRPLCAYPAEARYRGTGDPMQAENFECKAGAK